MKHVPTDHIDGNLENLNTLGEKRSKPSLFGVRKWCFSLSYYITGSYSRLPAKDGLLWKKDVYIYCLHYADGMHYNQLKIKTATKLSK